MTFIRNIASLFASKTISVEIDPDLLTHLDTVDKITTNRIITFNLYKLIYHIGAIQSRRFATSNRMKFVDKSDLIEKLYSNTNEFRVKVNDIRTINGTETLTSISEDFGVGISVVIAESLFKIKSSTIQKIYGTGSRPDWKCQTEDNRILVVECKGSSNPQTSQQQQIKALIQKTKEPGDVQIASLTLINENSISTNRFLDPPIESGNISPMMENHILRAGHYASVFSFLGNSKLSKYYSQMRKRLEGKITPYEQQDKNDTFRQLKIDDPTIYFSNKSFVGLFYKVEIGKYLFVAVDKKLLSYSGFIEFEDYQEDTDTLADGNHYILFKDGVLIIEIENIQIFSGVININNIQNYQNKITVSDIDAMNEISFSKYFINLLERNGFTNIREDERFLNFRIDIIADFNEISYFFELKIYKNKKINKSVIDQINFYRNNISSGKMVLVTNRIFRDENTLDSDIIIIDRNGLKKISHNYKKLIKILNIDDK